MGAQIFTVFELELLIIPGVSATWAMHNHLNSRFTYNPLLWYITMNTFELCGNGATLQILFGFLLFRKVLIQPQRRLDIKAT